MRLMDTQLDNLRKLSGGAPSIFEIESPGWNMLEERRRSKYRYLKPLACRAEFSLIAKNWETQKGLSFRLINLI